MTVLLNCTLKHFHAHGISLLYAENRFAPSQIAILNVDCEELG